MMCPPFCFFMPAVSRLPTALLLRSCAACRILAQKNFPPCPNPPSTRCSEPRASCVELRLVRIISRSPFAGKSAFPRATTVGNLNR